MTTAMKTDPGLAVFPSWENVANTFQRHFEHYWQHGSGENAVVGLRAEGSVTLQYAGRVVYELFQNALDQKGNSRAVVRFDGHTLIVGNDGQGISIDPNYDYQHPKLSEARSDFMHCAPCIHPTKMQTSSLVTRGSAFVPYSGLQTRCAFGAVSTMAGGGD